MHKSLVAAAVLAATARAHTLTEAKVNVYWGQRGDARLRDHCDQANFDYVTIGAHCDATYYTNGTTSGHMNGKCSVVASDIKHCQEKGKKVLLSLDGVEHMGSRFSLSSEAKAEEFASFLWGAFGPYDAKWTGPRPFDFAGHRVSVDGFNLDGELKLNGGMSSHSWVWSVRYQKVNID